VKGLTKISKIWAFSAPFGKFSSILCRTPNSSQGGQFCAKFSARRIAESGHPYLTVSICLCAQSRGLKTSTRTPEEATPRMKTYRWTGRLSEVSC